MNYSADAAIEGAARTAALDIEVMHAMVEEIAERNDTPVIAVANLAYLLGQLGFSHSHSHFRTSLSAVVQWSQAEYRED